jgi:hypothetical protein
MTTYNPNPVALKCPQCGANLPPDTSVGGYAVCQYCGSSLVWNQPKGPGGNADGSVAHGLRMKPLHCVDHEGSGVEIFRMLAPPGWQSRGGCRWMLDNPGMPACINFQVWNPHGGEAFEILPNMNFTWNTNPLTSSMFRPGSRTFGAEVYQPVSIRDAFRRFVLPRYRSMYVDLQILKEEQVPDLPRIAKSDALLTGNQAEGGKVRIGYTWQGWRFEEEIYGVVEVFRTLLPSMLGPTEFTTWFIDFLFSFRATAGKLDASADLFKLMLGSFHLNPQWYADFRSVAQFLAQRQIQHIHHVGQVGQILAQTGREIREQNLQDWYSRQDVYERQSVEWSRQIRDMEGFYDPHQQEVVELPAGYGHAWANALGEYVLTDDPHFNPNLDSNQHWEPMQQQ